MAISSSVSGFLQNIKNGVRPNLYEVDIVFPPALSVSTDEDTLTGILCKSAALPASNLGVIEVPFRGRTVKIAGDRTFDTWTATFFNDGPNASSTGFKVRKAFEKWMDAINQHEKNSASLVVPSSTGYTASILVKQLERSNSAAGNVIATYKLWDCFPTNISQIDLAYDSNDQIEEFTVEFQVQYWTRGEGTSETDVVAGA